MATTTTPTVQGQLLVSVSDMSMLKDIKKAISRDKGVIKVQTQRRPIPRRYEPATG